jgi:radical SAM protein with 4Fe4S-binding SPASM domain
MRAARKAQDAGMEFQINTTISNTNIDQLDEFCAVMEDLKPALWSVFLLVPTGRAIADDLPTPEEMESFLLRLHRYSKQASFPIKTTEGSFYRRIAVQQSLPGESALPRRGPVGINDGKGFAFISHTGQIYPSGFLPADCGNVKTDEFIDVYQNHPLFQQLRDPDALKGKCHDCEFRSLCGGSRARAWCMTGDALASDPLCAYEPTKAKTPAGELALAL